MRRTLWLSLTKTLLICDDNPLKALSLLRESEGALKIQVCHIRFDKCVAVAVN